MSNGKNPLMLMMALAMPGAAHALGLGDIHVDSALNERLVAQIDIIGASAAELTDLRAARGEPRHLPALRGRPSGLPILGDIQISQDSQGRPVLAVRSTEAFSEPMVNFLVDLRWHNGELVRQYTLLLDPPGFAAANRAAEAARLAAQPSSPSGPAAPDLPAVPMAAAAIAETKTQTVTRPIDPPNLEPKPTSADRSARKMTHVKVGAKATLRGVAWRVGERSESDIQRMMVAIFRANPSAFDGNIIGCISAPCSAFPRRLKWRRSRDPMRDARCARTCRPGTLRAAPCKQTPRLPQPPWPPPRPPRLHVPRRRTPRREPLLRPPKPLRPRHRAPRRWTAGSKCWSTNSSK